MSNANLSQALALERCRLYLAQISALTYCLSNEKSSDMLGQQIFDLVVKMRDDFLLLEPDVYRINES